MNPKAANDTTDQRMAHQSLRRLAPAEKEVAVFEAMAEAAQLLNEHWMAIWALDHVLLAKRTLNGNEIGAAVKDLL